MSARRQVSTLTAHSVFAMESRLADMKSSPFACYFGSTLMYVRSKNTSAHWDRESWK